MAQIPLSAASTTFNTQLNKNTNFDLVSQCPTFLQERIIKQKEFRIVIIGNKIFSVGFDASETKKGAVDWRRSINELRNIKHEICTLPKDIEEKLFTMTKHYNLNYSAIDMALTPEGQYIFFETNPKGQFLWLEAFTGIPLGMEMAKLLCNK